MVSEEGMTENETPTVDSGRNLVLLELDKGSIRSVRFSH